VRLVEGNEDRVSKPQPPRMGPGGRASERGPAPAVSRSSGRAGAQIGDSPLRGNEAGRVRAAIGHGSDSLGPHIEGEPARVLVKDDAPAPRPLAETARAIERPLSCCEPLS
jgi:hypothetical protein